MENKMNIKLKLKNNQNNPIPIKETKRAKQGDQTTISLSKIC